MKYIILISHYKKRYIKKKDQRQKCGSHIKSNLAEEDSYSSRAPTEGLQGSQDHLYIWKIYETYQIVSVLVIIKLVKTRESRTFVSDHPIKRNA